MKQFYAILYQTNKKRFSWKKISTKNIQNQRVVWLFFTINPKRDVNGIRIKFIKLRILLWRAKENRNFAERYFYFLNWQFNDENLLFGESTIVIFLIEISFLLLYNGEHTHTKPVWLKTRKKRAKEMFEMFIQLQMNYYTQSLSIPREVSELIHKALFFLADSSLIRNKILFCPLMIMLVDSFYCQYLLPTAESSFEHI